MRWTITGIVVVFVVAALSNAQSAQVEVLHSFGSTGDGSSPSRTLNHTESWWRRPAGYHVGGSSTPSLTAYSKNRMLVSRFCLVSCPLWRDFTSLMPEQSILPPAIAATAPSHPDEIFRLLVEGVQD